MISHNSEFETISEKMSNYEITAKETLFEGLTKNSAPYSISAKKAIKISPDLYLLEQVMASYGPNDKKFIIHGDHANLDNLSQKINLTGNITGLFEGVVICAESMQLDLTSQEIMGNDQVSVDYNNSKIIADKMQIRDKNFIIMEGNVAAKFFLPGL